MISGGQHPSEREKTDVCVSFVSHTTFLVFGVVEKSHQDELVSRLNPNYVGDTKYHISKK